MCLRVPCAVPKALAMPILCWALLALTLASLVGGDVPQTAAIDEGCLSCMCQAATGCDANRKCDGATCGMFAISRQFWKDAGEPGGDFETCALEPACATQCVRSYMHKFSRDCDGDGALSCGDYCRMHRLGREGCGGTLDAAFSARLASCDGSIPLSQFYSRAVSRPVRQQGNTRQSGNGGSQPSGRGPTATVNNIVSVTIGAPSSQGGGRGSSPSSGGYQNSGRGYPSSAGYQAGGYQTGGYQTGGYQTGGYQAGYGSGGYLASSGYQSGSYLSRGGYGGSGYGAGGGGGYGSSGVGSGRRGAGAGAGAGAASTVAVSQACLSCICNALTGCDRNAGCSNGGCGPFRLSQAYWQDCGAPGGSYEFCTRDYSCSSSCARAYLTKYAQDCNGDGVIDCRDYVRIHRLGGFGCRGALDGSYGARVNSCPA